MSTSLKWPGTDVYRAVPSARSSLTLYYRRELFGSLLIDSLRQLDPAKSALLHANESGEGRPRLPIPRYSTKRSFMLLQSRVNEDKKRKREALYNCAITDNEGIASCNYTYWYINGNVRKFFSVRKKNW